MRNLLVNAIEHADERPVEITVAQDRHAVAVVVRDHGVGLTEDEALHVFDRFWRADPARAGRRGHRARPGDLPGGRAPARWVARGVGAPGEGAAFRLTLPLRAGIRLATSPLPLVPDEPTQTRGLGAVRDAPSLSGAEDLGRDDEPSALPALPEGFGEQGPSSGAVHVTTATGPAGSAGQDRPSSHGTDGQETR
ncbi:ATP-binding protein [Oerskovia sp. M15]